MHICAQAQMEESLIPRMLLPLALLVLIGAIVVAIIKAWGLDPLVDKDLQLLTQYSGAAADFFGANLLGVVANYAYGASVGCLCYILPYWFAYLIAFVYPMLLWKPFDININVIIRSRNLGVPSLFDNLRAEFYKFVTMAVMMGLCFKYGSMPKDVLICSYVALIVLTVFWGVWRMAFASQTPTPPRA